MNYFITGGAGFVGGYVVRALARDGHHVVVFDLTPNQDYLADLLSPVERTRVRVVS
jgi:nucleoside-diphosphate-sugar epimerase